jgi:hypothetical protein
MMISSIVNAKMNGVVVSWYSMHMGTVLTVNKYHVAGTELDFLSGIFVSNNNRRVYLIR